MFSLRMLLVVVAIAALYIAGMAYPTEWWEASLITLTYVIYAGAITAAIAARQHRMFFVAFAVFGLAYWAMLNFGLGAKMVTERVLDKHAERVGVAMYEAAQKAKAEGIEGSDHFAVTFTYGGGQDRLKLIGQLLVAFLISLVAGVVAEAVVRKSKPSNGNSTA